MNPLAGPTQEGGFGCTYGCQVLLGEGKKVCEGGALGARCIIPFIRQGLAASLRAFSGSKRGYAKRGLWPHHREDTIAVVACGIVQFRRACIDGSRKHERWQVLVVWQYPLETASQRRRSFLPRHCSFPRNLCCKVLRIFIRVVRSWGANRFPRRQLFDCPLRLCIVVAGVVGVECCISLMACGWTLE